MRWAIVGVTAAACVLGIVGSLAAYDLIAATAQDGAQSWQQHRLAFLKSAYDQIQAEIVTGGSAVPSLRREAGSLLRDMAVVAKPMPADSVPSDIRALLASTEPRKKNGQAPPIKPVTMQQSVRATADQATLVEPLSVQPIVHPGGASIRLKTIEFHRDSIILSATIANLGDQAIRLNRARSFVLVDSANGVHYLNPPLGNAEVEVPPHTEMSGDLVFIGPLAPLARYLTLSTNEGIGTLDNPDDTKPVLKAEIPLNDRDDSTNKQAVDLGGVALRAGWIVGGPATCAISLLATNGTEHTIALSEKYNLTLTDDRGTSAAVEPPPGNRQLIVPSGARLEAELVFDCRQLGGAAEMTLTANQDITGTIDKPDDVRPVLTLSIARDQSSDAPTVANSHASLALIARSHLVTSPIAVTVAPPPADGSAVTQPAAIVVASASSDVSSEAPSEKVGPEVDSSGQQAKPPLAAPDPPPTLSQLGDILHAENTERGLRLRVPVDSLFSSTDAALDSGADPLLSNLAGLIASMQPREIVINVRHDPSGKNAAEPRLAKKRAHALVLWLTAHGPKRRPHFVERSDRSSQPTAANKNIDGTDDAEQNRQIEILLRRN